jgi:hypothetical protein
MLVEDDIRMKAERILLGATRWRYFVVRKEEFEWRSFPFQSIALPAARSFPDSRVWNGPGFYAAVASSESRSSLPDLADPSPSEDRT